MTDEDSGRLRKLNENDTLHCHGTQKLVQQKCLQSKTYV